MYCTLYNYCFKEYCFNINFLMFSLNVSMVKIHVQADVSMGLWLYTTYISVESQKGVNAVHRYSVENQKGAIAID